MTISAVFTVNGSAVTGAVAVAYGSTVTLALTSLSGVNTINWEIVGNDHSSRTNPTITTAGSPPGATASFTMVADAGDGLGASFLVRCTVTDGGRPSSSVTFSAIVGVANPLGLVPFSYGEELERSSTHGWTEAINQLMAGNPNYYEAATTTNATTTTVVTIPIAANTTVSIAARWHGRISAGTTQAMREATLVYRRVGAGPVQWGSDNDVFATTKDDAAWGALDHAVSSNNVILRVTGKAATTINWKVSAWTVVL